MEMLYNGKVRAWTYGVQFEEEARKQVANMASLPFVEGIAVMPDVHWGIGATVGSVIATSGAIVPAAVGVDIGCGMIAARLSLRASQLPDNLEALRHEIERRVPHGRTNDGGPGDRGAWHDIPGNTTNAWLGLQDKLLEIIAKHEGIKTKTPPYRHLGTLGTGNHFIEVCIDDIQDVWIVLHSGSRGIGNRIGSYFIERARREMDMWHIALPDKDLAYLPDKHELFHDYTEAVGWAQNFAASNRELMLLAVADAVESIIPGAVVLETINCHHNYLARENFHGKNVWVTRKGAVRARLGDRGVIPGSMGARSYIVSGLGNELSFNSCSHGAGRAMSRAKARKSFTLEDHIEATAGVECRKDAGVLDETPGAYKDIDQVMFAQRDLVKIERTLKQVLCVKG
jgi:tRNA-splicing ligase RtcB